MSDDHSATATWWLGNVVPLVIVATAVTLIVVWAVHSYLPAHGDQVRENIRLRERLTRLETLIEVRAK